MADLPAKPANRKEEYLSSIAGLTSEVPPCPYSREEAYLDAINDRLEDIDQEIQDLENNPDVTDIVDTYADLMAYDTSTLTDKDIIRVLNDETHNNESTYYRYSKATDTWTYIGSTGPKGGVQSDWEEDNSEDPAYIKNRPFYSEGVESEFEQFNSTDSGATPETGYNWRIEKVEGYELSEVLADFEDGDTIRMTLVYSVNGVEKTDGSRFTLTIDGDDYSLDYDVVPGTRWTGAYASEIDDSTTFRWPVSTADSGSTIYLVSATYERIKQLDPKYIPVDGDTVRVNADGELEADVQGGPTVVQTTGTSTTDVMSQNAVTEALANAGGLLTVSAYYDSDRTGWFIRDFDDTTIKGAIDDQKPILMTVENFEDDGGRQNYLCYRAEYNSSTITLCGGQARGLRTSSTLQKPEVALYKFTINSATGGVTTNNAATAVPTVVQTTGTSTTDVMSQNAVTGMVFADPAATERVRIGANASSTANRAVAIGKYAYASATNAVAIGGGSGGSSYAAQSTAASAVAIGPASYASQPGQFDIGAGGSAGTRTDGYNNSAYRLLTGVYDGQSAHDAATKGQLDTAIINGGTTAPTTSTVGAVGTQYTYVDTTGTPTAHLCVCTEVDNTDPSNPVYTWQTLI